MTVFILSRQRCCNLICAIPFVVIVSLVKAAPLPEWASAPVVNSADTITMKESILRAFGRDPEIAQQSAQIGISKGQIDEAESAWYPQIALTGNAGPSRQYDSSGSLDNSMSYGITLTQLIYDFGKTNNSIREQAALHDSDRFKLMSVLSDAAEKTAQAYIEANRYQALSDAAQKNIHALEGVFQMAKLRANAGLASTSDELQAQTRIAGMRSSMGQYQAQLQSAKAQLAVLTGIQVNMLSPPPSALAEQPVSLNNINYAKVPAVLAAENLRQSAEFGVEKTKSEHWPTLSLQGAKTRNVTSDRSFWNDQLQLNVNAPIYQGGAVSARVEQAEGKRQQTRSMVDQAKLDVLQKASIAFADWSGAKEREDVIAAQTTSAENTRTIYQGEYKLGTRSLSDLLSVEQEIFQAQSAAINANYDGWSAAIKYAAAVNNLIPLVGINAGIYGDLPELN